jgi:hypothetical protein
MLEICCGLEEEGVPFSIVGLGACEPRELAARNPLGTCIILSCDRAELYFHRLDTGPLFQVVLNQEKEEKEEDPCRRLGKNAARLVKGRPFELDQRR